MSDGHGRDKAVNGAGRNSSHTGLLVQFCCFPMILESWNKAFKCAQLCIDTLGDIWVPNPLKNLLEDNAKQEHLTSRDNLMLQTVALRMTASWF